MKRDSILFRVFVAVVCYPVITIYIVAHDLWYGAAPTEIWAAWCEGWPKLKFYLWHGYFEVEALRAEGDGGRK